MNIVQLKIWISKLDQVIGRTLPIAALTMVLVFQMIMHSSIMAVRADDPTALNILGKPINTAYICGPDRLVNGTSDKTLCPDCHPIGEDEYFIASSEISLLNLAAILSFGLMPLNPPISTSISLDIPIRAPPVFS